MSGDFSAAVCDEDIDGGGWICGCVGSEGVEDFGDAVELGAADMGQDCVGIGVGDGYN